MNSSAALDADTATAIQQAMAAARTGRIKEACDVAESALSRGGDPVALNALLGMLYCRSGNMDRGITHLREAHRNRPQDITIACNLISALMEAGRAGDALQVATMELAAADPSLRVARYRGFLAQQAEDFAGAVEAYELVVAKIPGDWETWNNLGNARNGAGDPEGGVEALKRAVELNPEAAPTRLNLASALLAADRADEAEDVLRSMSRDDPDDAKPFHELYVLYKKTGRDGEALPFLEEAVARDGRDAGLQLKLGIECGFVERMDDAERAFRKAIELDPTIGDAYLGLAVHYEHTNREEEFAELVALAERNGIRSELVDFIRALEHRRAKRFEEALDCLSRVPEEVEPQRTVHIRATLLDRLGRHDEAFAAFAEANRIHEEDRTDPIGRARAYRDFIARQLDLLTPEWVAGWTPPAPSTGRPDPVFLVGFPRSGTTLLDTILMGHPDVQVMEERPPLHFADREAGGLEALAGLDEAAIERVRDRYFKEAAAYADIDRGGLLVDKSPLYLQKVPLIHRLFPNARFILALRHPADVMLSCFMSNFRLNEAMSCFLRLEDAAELYDLTFQSWEKARSIIPVDVHTIVYERMIDDPEAELRPLFEFLGLEWRDEVLDHTATARSRGLIKTASYSQVAEPIYKRARGRWTGYREHLRPILPVLAPWAGKFGYSLDDTDEGQAG